jgi:uncharacterized repeat protein (TIGR03803 family)
MNVVMDYGSGHAGGLQQVANSAAHSRSTHIPLKVIVALVLSCASMGPLHAQTFKVIHNFGTSPDGAAPFDSVTGDASGNLYGVTFKGPFEHGCFFDGCGTVFKLSSNLDGIWTETILYEFTGGSDGLEPVFPVAVDSKGNVYGTSQGIGQQPGTVFELVRNSDGSYTQQTLYTFTDPVGGLDPFGITLDRQGRVLGTTEFGGRFNGGVVFSLSRVSVLGWHENVLLVFNDRYGATGRLLLDDEGNIYGNTYQGGAHGKGAVFKLTPNDGFSGWTETILYSFADRPDGANPYAGLTFDNMGNLYGTTEQGGNAGCGTVFELTPDSNGGWNESVLYAFQGGNDGCYADSGVTFDSAGNLYGTTVDGGAGGARGTVFKLTHSVGGQWSERVIHSFTGPDGLLPYDDGRVFIDSTDNVYGTAVIGGSGMHCTQPATGCGVVWEITP